VGGGGAERVERHQLEVAALELQLSRRRRVGAGQLRQARQRQVDRGGAGGCQQLGEPDQRRVDGRDVVAAQVVGGIRRRDRRQRRLGAPPPRRRAPRGSTPRAARSL